MLHNKIKEKIRCCIVYLLVLIGGMVFYLRPIESLDELWNYNACSNMARGLLPYRDFNHLVTPFSFVLGGVFIKLLGEHLLSLRIALHVLLLVFFYYGMRIGKKMGKSECTLEIICAFLCFWGCLNFCYDYNFISLLLVFMLLDMEIDREHSGRASHFLEGMLAGILILTKQTNGVYVSGALIINKCIIEKESRWKNMIFCGLGVLLPVAIFFLWLFRYHMAGDFFDYCFWGALEFDNHYSFIQFISQRNAVMLAVFLGGAVLLPLITLHKVIKNNKAYLRLWTISAAFLLMVYPISDIYHIGIGALPMIFLFFMTEKEKRIYEYKDQWIWTGIMAVCEVVLLIAHIPGQNDVHSSLQHMEGLYIERELEKHVYEVNEQIMLLEDEGYEVIIADAHAALYNIPRGSYFKNFDMFLQGNLGTITQEELIEAAYKNNVLFLIREDEMKMNWQTPVNMVHYMKDNLSKTNDIGEFGVYEKRQ